MNPPLTCPIFWRRLAVAFGATAALERPFLFRVAEPANRVLDGKVGQGVLDKLTPHGVQGLAFLENGWREVTNSRRPVRSHEDIKGL